MGETIYKSYVKKGFVSKEELLECNYKKPKPGAHSTHLMTVKMWKQPKCLSTDNMENIHAIEYYFTIRRNDEMIYATTQMHTENMLSERSET